MRLTPEERREVGVANTLVERSVQLARAIVARGGHVLFENPPDRGDCTSDDSVIRRLYQQEWGDHAPLWEMQVMKDAKRDLGLCAVTFPQCQLGSRFQKFTTLWYSPALAPVLDKLHICDCHCTSHREIARGRDRNRKWISAEAAAYPAQMNAILADAASKAIDPTIVDYLPKVEAWYTVNSRGQLSCADKGALAATDLGEC